MELCKYYFRDFISACLEREKSKRKATRGKLRNRVERKWAERAEGRGNTDVTDYIVCKFVYQKKVKCENCLNHEEITFVFLKWFTQSAKWVSK